MPKIINRNLSSVSVIKMADMHVSYIKKYLYELEDTIELIIVKGTRKHGTSRTA